MTAAVAVFTDFSQARLTNTSLNRTHHGMPRTAVTSSWAVRGMPWCAG